MLSFSISIFCTAACVHCWEESERAKNQIKRSLQDYSVQLYKENQQFRLLILISQRRPQMFLFFGFLERFSFSGKIMLPVKCRAGFRSHLPAFPLAAVTYRSSSRSASNRQFRGGVQHSLPVALCPGSSSEFPGAAWLHADTTWQSAINALLLTTVTMRSLRRPAKEWAWGP